MAATWPGALPRTLKVPWQSTHIALLPPCPAILLPATVRLDLGPAHRESVLSPRRASDEVMLGQMAHSLKAHKKMTRQRLSTIRRHHDARERERAQEMPREQTHSKLWSDEHVPVAV